MRKEIFNKKGLVAEILEEMKSMRGSAEKCVVPNHRKLFIYLSPYKFLGVKK